MPSKNPTRVQVLTLALIFTLALLLFPHFSIPTAASPDVQVEPLDKIEPLLLDRLATDGTADFIVRFAEQADLSPAYSMGWRNAASSSSGC